MTAFDTNTFDIYQMEVQEKWGGTPAHQEYTEKSKTYSKEKQNILAKEMDHIMAEFATVLQNGNTPDSPDVQRLVNQLQCHITQHYYRCTSEILFGLGKMYVTDERFKKSIDKHAEGTAEFISKAIEVYCTK